MFSCGLLHDGCGNDAARQRRKTRYHIGPVHHQGANQEGKETHPRQPRKTHDHRLPLLNERFQTDHRTHVNNQEVNS